MIGTGNRYCENISQQSLANPNVEVKVKRFALQFTLQSVLCSFRLEICSSSIYPKSEKDRDRYRFRRLYLLYRIASLLLLSLFQLKSEEIIRKCLTNSNEKNRFCKQKLHEVQQGVRRSPPRPCFPHSSPSSLGTSWYHATLPISFWSELLSESSLLLLVIDQAIVLAAIRSEECVRIRRLLDNVRCRCASPEMNPNQTPE